MKQVVIIVVVLVAVAGLTSLSSTIEIWDGSYHLTIEVTAAAERPKWVWCHQTSDREHAERNLAVMLHAERKNFESWLDSDTADPFNGQALTLNVWISGRDSPIFGSSEETQYRQFMVIIAEMQNGTRVGKIVEIPDHKVSKRVSVSIP
jgi:hypothetical protein